MITEHDARFIALFRLLAEIATTLADTTDVLASLNHIARLLVPDCFRSCLFTLDAIYGSHGVEAAEGASETVYRVALEGQRGAIGSVAFGLDPQHAELGKAIADEVAGRIASIITIARAFEREHHVADTLQRALLPETLPSAPGLQFSAAYDPGASEAIVGGDWYDAFPLPGGRIALSIGDVAGHGLRAAVVMGEVRQAFRAAAVNPESPSQVIERANAIVNMRANPVIVTALFGIYDPSVNAFTYAVAGHPPPMLATTSGMAIALPGGGLPLGVTDAIETRDWTIPIPPSALLALFTDGLFEFDRDVMGGLERLLEAVREVAATTDDDAARAIHQRIFARLGNTDDAATLALHVHRAVGDTLDISFSAVPFVVPLLRDALRSWCVELSIGDADAFEIVSAIGEALANVVEHAYPDSSGLARLHATIEAGAMVVQIEDGGRWKPAQRSDERGRGLPIMRALMDGVQIQSGVDRKTIRLRRALPPPEASATIER